MKKLILIFLFLLMTPNVWATTYYIRKDGGNGVECTGLANSAYDGSGSGEACALNHPNWVFPPNSESTTRQASAGDTVIVGTGSYKIGCRGSATDCRDSDYNLTVQSKCDADYPYDCLMGIIPSNVSVIGCTSSGCSSESIHPEFWGNGRIQQVINLIGSSGVTLKHIEITDHSSTGENHPSLSGGSPSADDGRAKDGIRITSTTNLTLTGVNIHGLYRYGIRGCGNGLTATDTKVDMNSFGGWSTENDSCDGTISWTGTTPVTSSSAKSSISWNGCVENWTNPGRTSSSVMSGGCYSQGTGGYGDGFGSVATDGIFTFTQTDISFNTSDGLDFLYLNDYPYTDGTLTVKRSRVEGNLGNSIKGPAEQTIEDNVIIGNCGFFSGQSFAQSGIGSCRAGGHTLVLAWKNNSTTSPTYYNNTIVGGGRGILITASKTTACQEGIDINFRNNIIVGGEQIPFPASDIYLWYNDETSEPCIPELKMQDNICTYADWYSGVDCTDTISIASDPSRHQTSVSGNALVSNPTDVFTGTITQTSPGYQDEDYIDQLLIKVGSSARNIANTGIGDAVDFNNFDRDDADSLWDAGALEYGTVGTAPGSVCGDDTTESPEVCDGTDVNSKDCTNYLGGGEIFDGGTLGCLSDCTGYDTSACTITNCGNGSIDSGEDCDTDGPLLGGATCASLGYSADPNDANLACTADTCLFNTSSCVAIACQDGYVEGSEQCDDGNSTEGDGCSSLCENENASYELLLNYTEADTNNKLSVNTHRVTATGLGRDENANIQYDFGASYFDDFIIDLDVTQYSCQSQGLGTITYDAGANSTADNASSITFAHTVASGSDRLLVVTVTKENTGGTISSVTYDSVSMTLATSASTGDNTVYIYYLLAPNVGTANAVVTFSGSIFGIGASADSFANVAQQAPEVIGTSTGTVDFVSLTERSLAVSGVVASISTATLATVDTELQNFSNTGSHAQGVAYKIVDSAGSDSMGWSVSTGNKALAVAVFAPAQSGSGSASGMGIISLSESSYTNLYAQDLAGDGIGVILYCESSAAQNTIVLIDASDLDTDTYVENNTSSPKYLRLIRTDTATSLEIYSDPARTVSIDTLSLTTPTTAYRYLMLGSSYNDSTTGTSFSGVIENVDITATEAPPASPATESFIINGYTINGTNAPSG